MFCFLDFTFTSGIFIKCCLVVYFMCIYVMIRAARNRCYEADDGDDSSWDDDSNICLCVDARH